jgi:hypothetical protein
MDVEVQRRPKSLDRRDSTTADAATLGSPALERQQGTDEDSEHGATELVVPGERVAEAVRQREHPLADGKPAQHVVDQVRGEIGHAPPTARRAKPPPLARERNQDLVLAFVAPETGEATGEDTARQVLAQLAFDEGGQPLAGAAEPPLLEEALEVLEQDVMQHAGLGLAAHVSACCALAVTSRSSGGRMSGRRHVARSRARGVPGRKTEVPPLARARPLRRSQA